MMAQDKLVAIYLKTKKVRMLFSLTGRMYTQALQALVVKCFARSVTRDLPGTPLSNPGKAPIISSKPPAKSHIYILHHYFHDCAL